MKSSWIWPIFWIALFGMITAFILDEPDAYITRRGIVTQTGCSSGVYKAHITYDCSVDIKWNDEEITREVIRFGVLIGDEIVIWCVDHHPWSSNENNPYICYKQRG